MADLQNQLSVRVGWMPHPLVDTENVTRLRPGVFVLDAAWACLFVEDRLRVRTRAAWPAFKNERATVTHLSAAALHDLPLYRLHDDRVDIGLPAGARRRKASGTKRHHVPLPDRDVTVIDGIRVTTLARTVYDVIRTVSLEAAVVVFDAALHKAAWDSDTNTYDTDAAERFRDAVRMRIAERPGARGLKQARFVAEFADGRSGSPHESVSRLWMWELGVPTPELQYRVDLPGDRYALLDFAWPALRKWGESDGQVKYTDPVLLAGRTAEEVMELQAERQAAVEQATKWTCHRWGTAALVDLPEFARYMRTAGLLQGRAA